MPETPLWGSHVQPLSRDYFGPGLGSGRRALGCRSGRETDECSQKLGIEGRAKLHGC
jgi:hypothetical protein